VINSLQRKYLELQEDFSAQNTKLAEANQKLLELTAKNITVTEFLDSILNSISAGVIAVDQNGRITHFNATASMIFGIPKTKILGKLYREIIPQGEPDSASAIRTAETSQCYDSIEKKFELKDNTRLHMSISTAVIKDSEGLPIGAVEVFQDLTKIKKMESEIARLNTLAALGEMAATVAHEVRNPLSGIGGFASLLDRDLKDDDPKKQLVQKIIKGVASLNDTVETLLNYSRFEEVNREEIDYIQFIGETISQFKNDNNSRLDKINFEFLNNSQSGDLKLSIDKMLFRQIFFNIYTNAVDAQNCSGNIKIEITKLPRMSATAKYSDRVLLGLDETVIETKISDSGPGISSEHIEKIFSPFYSTKAGGNGLGLAVAWKIIKAHGGEITVDNSTDGGAVFTMAVPSLINEVQGEQK